MALYTTGRKRQESQVGYEKSQEQNARYGLVPRLLLINERRGKVLQVSDTAELNHEESWKHILLRNYETIGHQMKLLAVGEWRQESLYQKIPSTSTCMIIGNEKKSKSIYDESAKGTETERRKLSIRSIAFKIE